MMVQQQTLGKSNVFNTFICLTCNQTMGKHWLFRADNWADHQKRGQFYKGQMFCRRDGLQTSHGHFQRVLRRLNADENIEHAKWDRWK